MSGFTDNQMVPLTASQDSYSAKICLDCSMHHSLELYNQRDIHYQSNLLLNLTSHGVILHP